MSTHVEERFSVEESADESVSEKIADFSAVVRKGDKKNECTLTCEDDVSKNIQEPSNKGSQSDEASSDLSSQKSSQGSISNSCSTRSSISNTASQKSVTSSRKSDDDNDDDDDDKKSSSSSSTLKGSQNANSDDENSNSSSSTVKNSQPSNANDSDDGSKSRSSLRSSSTRTLPDKRCSQSTVDGSLKAGTEDNDSRSSFASSNSNSTVKNNQYNVDKTDSESQSKSTLNSPVKKSSPVSSKPKKYFSIVDSDSEDDVLPVKSAKNDENDSGLTIQSKIQSTKKTKITKKPKLFDSDSEEENKKSKDDSGKENDKSVHSNAQSDKKSKIKNKQKLFDSDSEEDNKKNTDDSRKGNDKSINKSNKFSNIIDSESESDGEDRSKFRVNVSFDEENQTGKLKKGKTKAVKKRKGSARASKDAAMQQIHSETQRLIREAQVSLPYHRPKQRTLQEFLNRKKISPAIPQNLTCAEKVKLFSDVISKVVKEKEKEAEEFYKSDTDSEEEEKEKENNDVPTKATDLPNVKPDDQKEINDNMSLDSTDIPDSEIILQDHNKDSDSNLSTLQQRSSDLGVPRKLFLEDDVEFKKNNETETLIGEKKDIFENKSGLKEQQEPATELQECNTSSKLLTDKDEAMEICENGTSVLNLEKENLSNAIITKESEEKNSSSENQNEHESSTEDFVLQMPETETETNTNVDEKINESIKCCDHEKNKNIVEKILEIKNQEIIVEGPLLCNEKSVEVNNSVAVKDNAEKKEALKTPEEKLLDDEISKEETEDIVLKFPKDTNDEDEIISEKMLKNDIFKTPELDDVEKKPRWKEQILAKASKFKPMIKALPGDVIDFSDDEPLTEGVSTLMDRLTRHSIVHKFTPSVFEVKVMRPEGSGNDMSVIEEILPFNKTLIEDDYTKENKPGEKLQILKEDLKRKINSVRNEEWKQKEENEKEDEEDEDGKGKNDFYAGLPDDEEVLDDEVSTESEPEENDMPMVEKKRPKCDFGDEEAEESLDENDEDEADAEEDNEEEDEDEDEEIEDEEESEKEEEEINKGPKKLKRIIKPFDDDDSNDSNASLKNNAVEDVQLERKKTDDDMFASQIKSNFLIEDMDNGTIPTFVRDRLDSDACMQACKTPLPNKNMVLSMISPVAHLTVLNSAKKTDSKTPNFDLGSISTGNTPFQNDDRPTNNFNLQKMLNLQKKLFDDPPDHVVTDSQLLEICSGSFVDSQEIVAPPVMHLENQSEVTDSQLMEICSGSFNTQVNDVKQTENDDPSRMTDETSQDISLTFDNEEESKQSPVKNINSKSNQSILDNNKSKSPPKPATSESTFKIKDPIKSVFKNKNPMDAWLKKASAKPAPVQTQQQNDVTDSQILDICSGTFTSQPENTEKFESATENVQKLNESKSQSKSKEHELPKEKIEDEPKALWTGLRIASSSDEENKESESNKKSSKKKKLKKKKVQKLELSDDEDEEHGEFSDLEEESEYEEDEEEEEKFYDYDSDENEVVVVPKKEIKKVAKKYLENEAELSESEWGSDDEDEKGLDKYEYEEADAEDIDEDQVKNQLDRLHMKQVLDEDQRDVRMLQELLFDDGDLHSEGAGRERKFRWKNIDSLGDDDNVGCKLDDNEDGSDDDVDVSMEVQMRKLRYEQQKFLEGQEKQLVETIEDDFADSEILKSGLKVVSVRSNKTSVTEETITRSVSDTNKNSMRNGIMNVVTKKLLTTSKSLSFSNMKGSFLARGEVALNRIAQNLPESTNVSVVSNRKKKFVFAHISPKVDKAKEDSEHDSDVTPAKDQLKRKRKIIPSQQTPTSSKKTKFEDRKPGKKLFGF